MTLSRQGDRYVTNLQLSGVDWGSVRDLGSSFKGSFAWATGSATATAGSSGGGTNAAGSGMAAAAAAAAADFEAGGSTTDPYAPSSRYDPNAMNRIVDINDLSDRSDRSDDSDGAEVHDISQKDGNASIGPRAFAVATILGIVLGASLGIASLVNGRETAPSERTSVQSEQERLLEIAQRVVAACDESSLDRDMSQCQRLCRSSLCCFEKGQYSCADDEERNCAAHAGCEALIEGFVANGAGRKRVKWG